ncbi:MAG: hypothetical protein ABSC06_30360 [Rhodopila sp.]|jgi:hypothetical protein
MIENTTPITNPAQEGAIGPDTPVRPADALISLIVTLLAPMFLCVSGGDIGFARAAALETLNAYGARNHSDLIAIGQIVAFGLATIGSLSLSMADDISLSMTLRLRGNATALNRAAEQNRRVLREAAARPGQPAHPPEPEMHPGEAISDADLLVAATEAPKAATRDAAPAIVQAPNAAFHQAPWAQAMTNAAATVTAATLAALPPMEHRAVSLRSAMLTTTTTSSLLSGAGTPPLNPVIQTAMTRPQSGISNN